MNNYSYQALKAKRPLSIDGVQTAAVPSVANPPQPRLAEPPRRRTYAKPVTPPKEHKTQQKLQLPILIVIGCAGGFFADNLTLGLMLIAIYGITAFTTRISSRTTFTLALLLLTAISIMLLLKPDMQLIRNFATYAFALLLIGVLSLGKETRLPKRTRRKYRR